MTDKNINKETLKIIDEAVDEIIDVLAKSKIAKEKRGPSKISKGEREGLKLRLRELGRRVEEHIQSSSIDAVEAERLLSEKVEQLLSDQEKISMHLEGDIGELSNKLRMIKKDVKKLKKPKSQ